LAQFLTSSLDYSLEYGMDNRRLMYRFPAEAQIFLSLAAIVIPRTHPAPYPTDTWVFSLGVKRSGLEAEHSPLFSAP